MGSVSFWLVFRQGCGSAPQYPIPRVHLGFLLFRFAEPRSRYALGFGEESQAVLAKRMQIAEEGLFVTGEWEYADGDWNPHVDAHHAAVGPLGEFAAVVPALRKDHGTVAE